MKKIKKSNGIPLVVQASVIDDISSIIKKLFDTIFKGIDRLIEGVGWEQKGEAETVEKNGMSGEVRKYATGTDEIVTVTILQMDDSKDKFYIKMECKGHKPFEKKNVKSSDIEKWVERYIDDEMKATNEGRVDSSKRLRVTLQRVNASEETSVNLVAITANYPITLAMEDVENIVGDDDFVDTLTEEPQSFEITEVESEEEPGEPEYDVQEISDEEVDTSDSYEKILISLISCKNDVQSIAWRMQGLQDNVFICYVDTIMYIINNSIEFFVKRIISETDIVPHPGKATSESYFDTDLAFNYDNALQAIRDSVNHLIDELDIYYVNVKHDIQAYIDSLILNLKDLPCM